MSDGQIDYSRFTRAELNDALRSIDRSRYPKNYASLVQALSQAEVLPEKEGAPQRELSSAKPLPERSAAPLFAGTALPQHLVALVFGGTVLLALAFEFLYVKWRIGSSLSPGAGTIVGAAMFLVVALSAFLFGSMLREYNHSFKSAVFSALVSWSTYGIWAKVLGGWLGFGALAIMAALLGWRGGMVGGARREEI
jgi:hypothetical protein